MTCSVIGTGNVGRTLTAFFAKAGVEVALANTRGPEAVEPMAQELGERVVAKSLDEALKADVIRFKGHFGAGRGTKRETFAPALRDLTIADVVGVFAIVAITACAGLRIAFLYY
ncbi:MAG: NAD(P)-binding domain-containing protein [Gammaproteobacteria bacterium]